MESAMTTWTAVASSVADQGRRLAAAARPTCSAAAEKGRQACSTAAEKGRQACSTAAEKGRQACSCATEAGRQAGTVAWKVTRSTGKAAWIVGTSFVVLVAPIIILADCDARAELQEQSMEEVQRVAYMLGGRSA